MANDELGKAVSTSPGLDPPSDSKKPASVPKTSKTFASHDPTAKKRRDNKTVTFGDSSSVVAKPAYTVLALILMLVLWFVVTKAWGMPGDFIDAAQAEAAAEGNSLSDRELIRDCGIDDDCKGSFTQILGPVQFPTQRDTWRAVQTLTTDGFRNITLWDHTRTSLWRVARGMFFGSLIGIPIGLAMGLSSRLRSFFDAPVELFRPIPPLALIPLFIAFFGIADKSAVPLLIFASVWIMIIAARAGTQSVNLSKVRAAYSLGASKRQVLMRVVLPNALPELFTGVRVALGVSWGTLVAAELVGINKGLGAMIFSARSFLRTDIMVVGIVIIALLGVLMDLFIRFLERRLIPWRGKG